MTYNPDHYAFRRDSRGLGDLRPRPARRAQRIAAAVPVVAALAAAAVVAWRYLPEVPAKLATLAKEDAVERALPCRLPDPGYELSVRRLPSGEIACVLYRPLDGGGV